MREYVDTFGNNLSRAVETEQFLMRAVGFSARFDTAAEFIVRCIDLQSA
jgi:hypothetical protein